MYRGMDVWRNGFQLNALPLYLYTSILLDNYSLISLCNFQCTIQMYGGMDVWKNSFCYTFFTSKALYIFNAYALKVKYHIKLNLQGFYSSFIQTELLNGKLKIENEKLIIILHFTFSVFHLINTTSTC